MKLEIREERALRALCDPFLPGDADTPSATELGVPEALVQVVSRLPSALEPRAFRLLLRAFDTPLPAFASGKGFRRFRALPQQNARRSCCRGRRAPLRTRRAGFQALRRGAVRRSCPTLSRAPTGATRSGTAWAIPARWVLPRIHHPLPCRPSR